MSPLNITCSPHPPLRFSSRYGGIALELQVLGRLKKEDLKCKTRSGYIDRPQHKRIKNEVFKRI
jgi:hypothetical protein